MLPSLRRFVHAVYMTVTMSVLLPSVKLGEVGEQVGRDAVSGVGVSVGVGGQMRAGRGGGGGSRVRGGGRGGEAWVDLCGEEVFGVELRAATRRQFVRCPLAACPFLFFFFFFPGHAMVGRKCGRLYGPQSKQPVFSGRATLYDG